MYRHLDVFVPFRSDKVRYPWRRWMLQPISLRLLIILLLLLFLLLDLLSLVAWSNQGQSILLNQILILHECQVSVELLVNRLGHFVRLPRQLNAIWCSWSLCVMRRPEFDSKDLTFCR